MPFEEHPTFVPVPRGTVVWRYLDFTKFVALLDSRALWFSKPETFGDPWEGAYTKANLERQLERIGDSSLASEALRNFRANLQSLYVNCWQMGEVESAAMWGLYLASTEGVALQTTWGQLTDSIEDTDDAVYGGKVRYIDFEADSIHDDSNLFFPVTTKRLSFAHEAEARLVVWKTPDRSHGAPPDYEQIPPESGLGVPINLDRLMGRVVLAPGSADWFKELVHRVASKFDFAYPIEASAMDNEPTHLPLLPPGYDPAQSDETPPG